jgi:hypothetical protein
MWATVNALRGKAFPKKKAAESLGRSRRRHVQRFSASVRRVGYIAVKATAPQVDYFSSKVIATQNGAAIVSPTFT